jgi:pimeloyl-ACP methyl ester carboxylesterase
MKTILHDKSVFWYSGSSGNQPAKQANLPTLVFIHGASNDHSVWTMQARYLAHHGYPVVAVDLPGHGQSQGPALTTIEAMAQWLAQLLTQLQIDDCVLIGHSMGSLVALEVALQKKPTGLALLGSAVPMPVSEKLLGLIRTDAQLAMQQINFWSASTINTHPGNPGPGFSTYVQNLRLMQRQGAPVLLNDFVACNQYQGASATLANLRRQSTPTIVITGANDRMTPASAAQKLVASLGEHAQLHLLTQCGHALMAEQPHQVLHLLASWLAQTLTTVPSQLA